MTMLGRLKLLADELNDELPPASTPRGADELVQWAVEEIERLQVENHNLKVAVESWKRAHAAGRS